jgi:hypothetical protein
MTTTVNTNPANDPIIVTTNPDYVPGKSNVPASTDEKEIEQIANKAAHKAVKTEQKFDKENSNLFSK